MTNIISEDKDILVNTLPNGLRTICARTDGNVAYSGVLTGAGSRDDGEGCDGLAHFVEHTLFKGTARKSCRQIANRMELIGGELNAYTTKEHLMLHTTAPRGFEERGLEMLADLVTSPTFPPEELERERSVIEEEIVTYRDNPAYAVFDEFDENFFGTHPLAHNILGYDDTLRRLTPDDARRFLARNFTPQNMAVYCLSPVDPAKSARLMEKYFAHIDREQTVSHRIAPIIEGGFDTSRRCDKEQANSVIGYSIPSAHSEERFAFFLLSNILGSAAMNSRLNQELRDKRGLVYTVETNTTLMSDCGLFQIYFATDPANLEKCTRLVRREIEKLADRELSETAFRRATRQMCGQLLVAGDNRENRAMALAKNLLVHGRAYDAGYTARRIAALTPADLRGAALTLAGGKMSRHTIL